MFHDVRAACINYCFHALFLGHELLMAESILVCCSEEYNSFSCVLCFRVIEKAHERYFVLEKSKFNVKEAIEKLPFEVSYISSTHICRQCLAKLQKRSSLLLQERNIVAELASVYQKGKHKRQQDKTEEGPVTKRSNVSIAVVQTTSNIITTSKAKPAFHQGESKTSRELDFLIASSPPTVPLSHSTLVKEHQPARTSVNVRVSWPSKTVEKQLHPDLESLGKVLVRGTYKQIANAAWNSKHIRKHLIVNVLKQIDRECSNICSRKNPSCLRSPSKQKMLDFSFEKENEELEERAPLFYSVLVAGGCNRKKTDKSSWIPAVRMAVRSPYMNAVQLMLGIFLYHSNWAASTCIF